MKILMVLTSHDRLGDTNQKTGFWLDEFAAPYYVFKDNGCQITIASPAGGHPPIDPKSDVPGTRTKATERLSNDDEAQRLLANTLRLDAPSPEEFDAVFYPGGHGPLWDLAEDINFLLPSVLEHEGKTLLRSQTQQHGRTALNLSSRTG